MAMREGRAALLVLGWRSVARPPIWLTGSSAWLLGSWVWTVGAQTDDDVLPRRTTTGGVHRERTFAWVRARRRCEPHRVAQDDPRTAGRTEKDHDWGASKYHAMTRVRDRQVVDDHPGP